MGTPFFCRYDDRLILVRNMTDEGGDPLLNGIEYLEVSDDQRHLTVYFVHDLPAHGSENEITVDQVRIEGGVRIEPIRVDAVSAADNTLEVDVSEPGDFSTYRLRLVASPLSEEPPEGFDPILSEISFSFKVGCPSDLDCHVSRVCPPELLKSPPIDYLARDYRSFRRLMLDRMSTTMPGWTERNPADMTVALVETLAYAADELAYYQDAVATEAYLGTARKRVSLRRHARLVDYVVHEGMNARTWVHFEVDAVADGRALAPVDGDTGEPLRLLTRFSEEPVVAPDALATVLAERKLTIFEPLTSVDLFAAHNEIRFYPWGRAHCCLPMGTTRATLHDDEAARLRLVPGDFLLIEEVRGSDTGREEDADSEHRQVVRLTRVSPAAERQPDGSLQPGGIMTDPLTGEPIVEVEWDADDALTFSACISTSIGSDQIVDLSVARGNIVLADHGLSREAAPLVPSIPDPGRKYRPQIEEMDLTVADYSALTATAPATTLFQQDARRALPVATVFDGVNEWNVQPDLLRSDAFNRHFVVETDEQRRAHLRFGDGVNGAQPLESDAFAVSYRIGSGPAGNIGAEALAHVVTSIEGILSVRNPLPAEGGAEPERAMEVRQYAPDAFRVQERAITEADYAEMAERHPGVQKAVATRRWTGSWYTMFVSVDRRGGDPVTESFRDEMRAFLERFRYMGHDLVIDEPRFVPLLIVLTVCVRTGYLRSNVRKALQKRFSSRVNADGSTGFFHPDNFTFGQPVYVSHIIEAAMAIPGVASVDINPASSTEHRFQRLGEANDDAYETGKITMGRLEIARLDNDPNARENGRIDFILTGGR